MAQKYHYRRGGDSVYMFNLSDLLRSRGHRVAHFSMRHPKNVESDYSDYFTSELDYPALLSQGSVAAGMKVLARSVYNREARAGISNLLDDFSPDIAHFHNIHDHLTTSIIGPLHERGVPVVWTLHDYRPVCPNSNLLSGKEICERCLPGKFYNVLLHRCKKNSAAASFVSMLAGYSDRLRNPYTRVGRFIAPSSFMKRKLSEGGLPPEKITVLPNFMDTSGYGRSKEEGDYVVYFGRLSYEKGIDTLIRAFSGTELSRLVIAGEGPERKRLESLAAECDGRRVEFAGHLAGNGLRRLVASSKFVVLPSRWYENLPFSVMESMAAGKPVIASDIGGIPEMVEHGVTGLLFPPEDEERLEEAMRKLLSDPGLRIRMGEAARERAKRLYNSEVHYRGIIDIYHDLSGSG
jgi:glycosyltransferase involved in cell wall biosynthesis